MAFKRSGVRLPLAPPPNIMILRSYFFPRVARSDAQIRKGTTEGPRGARFWECLAMPPPLNRSSGQIGSEGPASLVEVGVMDPTAHTVRAGASRQLGRD